MKKIALLLTTCGLALMSALDASARYTSVTVHMKDKTSMTVDMCDDLAIGFTQSSMTITASTLDNEMTIAKENIDKFEHNAPSGISTPDAEFNTPVRNDGAIEFNNLPEGSRVAVVSTTGRIITESAVNNGYHRIELTGLTTGVYIIQVNNVTYKIAVK